MAKCKLIYGAWGVMPTNVYFLKNMETNETVIVDPADNAAMILHTMQLREMTPTAILLTHGHFDHMLALKDLKAALPDVKVYAHEQERALLADPSMNCSARWTTEPVTAKADVWVKDGDVLDLAGFQIQVIHTPGHTAGSCCYYLADEQILISGDTLFRESYGRVDLDTGSGMQMMTSIHKLVDLLPGDTEVYPGHGDSTDIAHEKEYNPAIF